MSTENIQCKLWTLVFAQFLHARLSFSMLHWLFCNIKKRLGLACEATCTYLKVDFRLHNDGIAVVLSKIDIEINRHTLCKARMLTSANQACNLYVEHRLQLCHFHSSSSTCWFTLICTKLSMHQRSYILASCYFEIHRKSHYFAYSVCMWENAVQHSPSLYLLLLSKRASLYRLVPRLQAPQSFQCTREKVQHQKAVSGPENEARTSRGMRLKSAREWG